MVESSKVTVEEMQKINKILEQEKDTYLAIYKIYLLGKRHCK